MRSRFGKIARKAASARFRSGWFRGEPLERAPVWDQLQRLWRTGEPGGLPFPLGTPGYTLPDLAGSRVVPLVPGRPGNWLILASGGPRKIRTEFEIDRGATGNLVIVGREARLPLSIHFQGTRNAFIAGGASPWRVDASVRFSSNDGLLFWGKGATSNGTSLILEGDGTRIIVGDDCMFAAGSAIRTSDLHALFSIETGAWLNRPANVLLEPHVWVGHDAMILKGVTVGLGSIIGAKSLANKDVARLSAFAGVPARLIKSGVSWDRARSPTLASKSQILDLQSLVQSTQMLPHTTPTLSEEQP